MYLASSDLLSGYTAGDLSVTRSYEANRNLLLSVENKFDATTISKYTYANDAGGRRTSVKTTGTAFMTVGDMFNLYNYNTRSELIGANRYFGDDLEDTGDPVGLQSFGYAYDNIGNRTSVTNSGDVTSYTPNNLNQYTQRQISDLINLRGSAETGATVTVKMGSSQSESVTRQDKYWHKQLTSTNDTEAQYPLIKVVGVAKNAATNGDDIVTIETGHVFVAKTPEQFTYDEDGNLLSDGRWTYSWNGENRLVSMETATNVPASVPVTRLEFVYDYQGRRVSKSVSQWVSNQWDEISDSTFIYDSWNLIRESSTGVSPVTNSYVWGLDLSGSLQGAGGIGGLLFRSDGGTTSVSSVSYVFDANGNVSELLTDTGEIAAHYEYDPYGNTLVSEGDLASDNVYRFSTKYTDTETKLLYYGFRYYSPSTGRWLSRDPIGELGNLQLDKITDSELAEYVVQLYDFSSYESMRSFENELRRLTEGGPRQAFVHNDTINAVDPYGLTECCGNQTYDPSEQCCSGGEVANKVKDPACLRDCNQTWLIDCYSAQNVTTAALGGLTFGAGTQQINQLGSKTGGIAGGGRSGTGASLTRSWARKAGFGATGRYATRVGAFARYIGRQSAGAMAAAWSGVTLSALHARCLAGYAGCRAGCKEACP